MRTEVYFTWDYNIGDWCVAEFDCRIRVDVEAVGTEPDGTDSYEVTWLLDEIEVNGMGIETRGDNTVHVIHKWVPADEFIRSKVEELLANGSMDDEAITSALDDVPVGGAP